MNLRQELAQFTSDGCTGFVNTWRNIDLYPCCFAHDMAWYLNPGDWLVWIRSNVDLGVCFVGVGAVELAVPAVILTSTVGAILFATAKRKTR